MGSVGGAIRGTDLVESLVTTIRKWIGELENDAVIPFELLS